VKTADTFGPFPDKKASEEADRKIRKLVDLRGAGHTLPAELVSWLESTAPAIRETLVKFGIIASHHACRQ